MSSQTSFGFLNSICKEESDRVATEVCELRSISRLGKTLILSAEYAARADGEESDGRVNPRVIGGSVIVIRSFS